MAYSKQLLIAYCLHVFLILIALLSFSCNDDVILNNPFDAQVSLGMPSELRIVSMKEFSLTLQWKSSINCTSPDVAKSIWDVIEQSTDGKTFVVVDTVECATAATIIEAFIPSQIYYFRVHAIVGSRISNNSNVISGNLSSYTPSNMKASFSSESKCRLSWKDNSLTEIGFRIERKLGAGGTFITIGQVPADTTTFVDSTIVLTDSVYYKICAVYDNGKISDYCSLTVFTSFTPSNLNADLISESLRKLSWQDHSLTETGFRIERKLGAGGTFITIGQVPANTTKFDDSTLVLTDTTSYRVCALYSDNISDYCYLAVVAAYMPSNFNAVVVSETLRRLSWQDNTSSELGFRIERKLSTDGTFMILAQLPANTTTFDDATVIRTDTTYQYRIFADYGNGNITKYCPLDIALPFPAPSSLRMSSISSTSLQLLWNDNSSFETGFLIERCEQNGVFATLTTTQANCTTYTDSQLDSTKEYQYRASAFTLTNNTKTPNPIRVSYFLPPIDAQTIRQYNGTYKVIQPSYDGSHLILGGNFSGNNGNGDFLFIDIAHPETIYWNTHGSNISCAAMSRDNIFVTTASDDNRLLLWYYYSWGSYVAVPLTKRVQKLVYSSLDTKFYGASEDNKIRCWNNPWNMGDGSLQFTTVALSDSITSLDVNSDGTLLVSASGSSINLWNISTGSLVYTFPSFAYSIGTMQCGPNNLVGISGNNSIQVIDLTTKTICFSATGYSNAINPFSFNGDGSLLFIGDNTNIEIWRMSDRQMAQKQDMHRSIIALFGAKYQNSIVTIDTKDAPTLTRNYYIAHYTWVSISQ